MVPMDDNEQPAPENLPTSTMADGEVVYARWEHSGICNCHIAGGEKVKAKVNKFPCDVMPTSVQFFVLFFPVKMVKEVMI